MMPIMSSRTCHSFSEPPRAAPAPSAFSIWPQMSDKVHMIRSEFAKVHMIRSDVCQSSSDQIRCLPKLAIFRINVMIMTLSWGGGGGGHSEKNLF